MHLTLQLHVVCTQGDGVGDDHAAEFIIHAPSWEPYTLISAYVGGSGIHETLSIDISKDWAADSTCGGSDKDEDEEELEANTMKDRSGNKYKTVVIGSQTWMAENMKYMGVDVQCRGRSDDLKYGCLYNWDDAKKVCPDGWHLPTKKDFDDLLAYADAHRTSKLNRRP